MEEVLGIPDTCISLPHVLSARGASASLLPELDDSETQALRHSAQVLREAIAVALES
jgi:L-lactate dehydrogenase